MDKSSRLRSRQEELVKRLQLYREKKEKAKLEAQKKSQATKHPVNSVVSCTKNVRHSTTQVTLRKTLASEQVKKTHLIKQNSAKLSRKNVTADGRTSYSKRHFINKASKENAMPNSKRRRSFTLAPHEASPLLQRPLITDDSGKSTPRKKRRLDSEEEQITPQKKHSSGISAAGLVERKLFVNKLNDLGQEQPQTENTEITSCEVSKGSYNKLTEFNKNKFIHGNTEHRTDSETKKQLSLRERLELWKKEKLKAKVEQSAEKPGLTTPRSSFAKCARKTLHISTRQSTAGATKVNLNHKPQVSSGLCKTSNSKPEILSHRQDVLNNIQLSSSFQRRKFYSQEVCSKLAASSKSVHKIDYRKKSGQIMTMSRHKCQNTGQSQDNSWKRRLSYAMSLCEKIEKKALSSERKPRRVSVSSRYMTSMKSSAANVKASHDFTKGSSKKKEETKPAINPSKVKIDQGRQGQAKHGTNDLTLETRKNCHRSLSVKFASCCTPVRIPSRKQPVTPVNLNRSEMMKPSRLSSVKKEPSLREKLNSWLVSRGKTPSRFTHQLMFGDDLSIKSPNPRVNGGLDFKELLRQQEALAKEETETTIDKTTSHPSLGENAERILSLCLELLDSDCPPGMVEEWLEELCLNLNGVQQLAEYWVCRMKIAQKSRNNNAVIEVFEESLRNNAQPAEKVANALKESVQNMKNNVNADCHGSPLTEPLPKMTDYVDGDTNPSIMSSAIKYLYSTTPFTKMQRRSFSYLRTPCAIVTPVRRSTRKSISNLPRTLRDHDLVVESISQLSLDEKKHALFVPNMALQV